MRKEGSAHGRACSRFRRDEFVPAGPPAGLRRALDEEKLRYVEALWERIAAAPDDVRFPDWHRELIRERLAEHRRDPDAARPWAQIRRELLRDLGARRSSSG